MLHDALLYSVAESADLGAGEMAGIRAGAGKVAQWLVCHWKGRNLPPEMPWHAVAAKLGANKGLVEPDVPLDGRGPWPEATPQVC